MPGVDDYVRLAGGRFRLKGTNAWWFAALVALTAFVVVATVSQDGVPGLVGVPGFLACVLVGLILGWLGMPRAVRRTLDRQCRENPQLLQPVTYVFSEREIRVESPLSTMQSAWTRIIRAQETENDFYLFVVRGQASYFVPRKALTGDDERRLRAILAARLGTRAELATESNR